jgi:hypothetical protein
MSAADAEPVAARQVHTAQVLNVLVCSLGQSNLGLEVTSYNDLLGLTVLSLTRDSI